MRTSADLKISPHKYERCAEFLNRNGGALTTFPNAAIEFTCSGKRAERKGKIASLLLAMLLCTGALADEYVLGATVAADADSPSGYTVTFAYAAEDENVTAVAVSGPFQYIDAAQELSVENRYTPDQYKAGMYPSNMTGPTLFESTWGNTIPMELDKEAGVWHVSFPITSGSFGYSYQLTKADGTTETVFDPANPAPARANPNTDVQTGDINSSIVYGQYDEEKQAGSPNLDFVRPSDNYGELSYVEYTGVFNDHQDLGIYLPAGYDAEREEPYKVVYLSHGGGGSEVDWFAMGHADNIVANIGADVIVVTMDNSSLEWDFDKIGDNMMNYIIPYMEANYNVSKEPKDRAFSGLSMGSMTTFHMFYDHATDFGYFGAYSGPDLSAINEEAEGIDSAVLYFTVGTEDMASSKIGPNADEGDIHKYEGFVAYLAEHPMDNVIDGGYVKGAHDWFTWSQSLYTFLTEVCWK